MKKITLSRLFIWKKPIKYDLKLKLTTLFLLISLFQIEASTYSQNTKLTLKLNNVTVQEAFEKMESLSDFRFLYNHRKVDLYRRVSIDVKKESISNILDSMFLGMNVYFKIRKKQIILKNGKIKIIETIEIKAQQQQIKGVVTDESGTPLPGVSILVEGTTNGTETNFDGEFTIETAIGDVLLFSFIGMETISKTITDTSDLSIIMKEDEQSLDEVIITGFGTQKRDNISGSVVTVELEEVLGDRPITNTAIALQGLVPGLQITNGSGEPGAEAIGLNIRGATSINGGNPLVLVDNVPVLIGDINARDIETITVLKDAAASSIYGARAAFGVILITTKKPKLGVPSFDFSLTTGWTTPIEIPEKASPIDFVTAMSDFGRDVYWSLGQDNSVWTDLLNQYNTNPSDFPLGYSEVGGIRYHLKQNDTTDDLFSETGSVQIYNLNVSGGTENVSYRISFGYSDEDGFAVSDKDSFKKYNVNSYTSVKLAPKLTLDFNMFYNNYNRSVARINYGGAAILPSFVPIGNHENEDGSFTPYGTPANIVLQNPANSDRNSNIRFFTKLEYKPIEDLTFTGEYTYEIRENEIVNVDTDPEFMSPTRLALDPHNNDNTSYYNERNNSNYKGLNLYANYLKSFGDHNFKVLAGFNYEEFSGSRLWTQRTNLISTELPSIGGATGEIRSGDSFGEWAVMSGFGRINYNYKEKYFLEANLRYDGSSRFAEGSRYGFFPSFSAAWNVAKESFMENQNLFSTLKLRASWGEVGNQNVEDADGNQNFYPSVLGLPSFNSNWLDPNQTQHVTLGEPGLISANFTWETVQTTNLALDVSMLKSRLNTTIEVYSRKTIDMITAGEQLPATLGTDSPTANAADLETKGWEFDISWGDKVGQDFWYQVGFNIFDIRSEITKFGNEAGLISQFYVGQEIGEIWGYVTDGFYTENDFVDGSLDSDLRGGTLKDGIPAWRGFNPNPGDVKYKDLNGDGEIFSGDNTLDNPGDQKIIGNSTRRLQYGAFVSTGYKNFDFSLYLNGVGKRDIVLDNDIFWPFRGQFDNIYAHQLDYWTPTNTDAYYPRNYETDASNYRRSRNVQTKYLQSGSYLNIKNITLGYTLPKEVLDKMHLSKFRLFISGENLFNIKDLPEGLHPEFDDRARGLSYPWQRKISLGLNISF